MDRRTRTPSLPSSRRTRTKAAGNRTSSHLSASYTHDIANRLREDDTACYDYDAFGNLEATSFETVANPFGFTARERDAESGLMFYRARYYDLSS